MTKMNSGAGAENDFCAARHIGRHMLRMKSSMFFSEKSSERIFEVYRLMRQVPLAEMELVKTIYEFAAFDPKEHNIVDMAAAGNLEVVQFLLDNFPIVYQDVDDAAVCAIRGSHVDTFRALIDVGGSFWYLLYQCIEFDCAECFEAALKDIEPDDDMAENAVEYDAPRVLDYILSNSTDIDLYPLFTQACMNGIYSCVEVLLKHTSNVSEEYLEIAEENGHSDIVDMLRGYF